MSNGEKEISYMSNEKFMIIFLIAELIKKTYYKMSQFFPKPYNRFDGNVKAELDLSNYATKTDLTATRIDTSNLAPKSNLPKLKVEVNKIEIDK